MNLINDVGSDCLYQIIGKDMTPPGDKYRMTEVIAPVAVRKQLKDNWDTLECKASEWVYALLGTSVHAMLEKYHPADPENTYIEKRLETEIDGITIGGTLDLLEGTTLEDWKCTGVYGATKADKTDWVN